MFAYFNVILIGDKNISDRDGIQLTAMGAECDDPLIHLIALITIDHFGIGEHLECRFSRPEFIQFVCCFIVVTFEPPHVFDHSSVRLELLLSFPFITYDPVVTRTVFAILWHEILPSRRFVNSDQCLFPFPLPIVFIFLTKPLGSTCGAHIRNVIISAKQLSQETAMPFFIWGTPIPHFLTKSWSHFDSVW